MAQLGDFKTYVEIASRGVGARADLMRFLDQSFGLRPLNVRQRDLERHIQPEPAL